MKIEQVFTLDGTDIIRAALDSISEDIESDPEKAMWRIVVCGQSVNPDDLHIVITDTTAEDERHMVKTDG